jgi:lysophospholipase L1-like esterase
LATVTGVTAAKVLAIEAQSVVSGALDGSGNLSLTTHDGTIVPVGVVQLPVPDATTSTKGKVQLATNTEATTGTDTAKAVTSAGVAAAITAGVAAAVPSATTSVQGKVELATTAETQTGTDTTRAVTPAGLAGTVATTSQKGVIQLATNTEVTTGTDTAKAATSAGVAAAITASATPSASTSTAGKVQLATSAEALAGTNTAKAIVPSTLAAYAPRNDLGIYVPPGWGQFWKPKRNAAASAQAVIGVVGSSSTQGLYSSNLLTSPYVSQIMTSLQTTYGDGGSGYFHTSRSLTFMGASTTANAWNALSGNFCTVTGSWSVGNVFGPGGNYIYTQTVGDTITFIVRGTKARVYTVSGAGRSNWSYTVDGGSSTSVTDSGTGGSTIQVTSINGLSSGSHTIVMTKAGSAGTSFAVCGVTGENNTGVVVNNYGMSGAKTYDINGFTNNYDPGRWSGGPDYPCDLLIYALGANDCNVGYTGDTYAANLSQFLQGVKDGTSVGSVNATGATDILILMQHIGKYDSNYKWQDYSARARTIAEAYGAALVEMWPIGRNSWNYWNSLGYWGNSTVSTGAAGTDVIHASNAGHTAMANAILPILTS